MALYRTAAIQIKFTKRMIATLAMNAPEVLNSKVKTASLRDENWRFWSEWQDSNSRHPAPK